MRSFKGVQRAISYFTPGLGPSEAYPTVLEREIVGGWERVSIRVPTSFLVYLSHHSGEVKALISDAYPSHPPVDPRDIVKVEVSPPDLISLHIRRGHLVLAEFFKKHEMPRLTSKGLECVCCAEPLRFSTASLPDYKLIGD